LVSKFGHTIYYWSGYFDEKGLIWLIGMLVVLIFTILFLVQLFLSVVMTVSYVGQPRNLDKKSITEVSVIIPFYNERKRISSLLDSINQLTIPEGMNLEFIFVDDQSSDETAQLIKEKLKKPFKLLSSSDKGKKAALHMGISNADYEWVISWDADIVVPKDYFCRIACLSKTDMWILPVKMVGSTFSGFMGSIEFAWLQVITYVSAKWQSPILCNGANLLFLKELYFQTYNERTDNHLPSGDDMFLLAAVRNNNGSIKAAINDELQVVTNAPRSYTELLAQRKRWAGKMGSLLNFETILLGGFLGLFSFGGLTCLGLSVINPWFFIPFGLKIFSELLVLVSYHKGNRFLRQMVLVLIHQVWHPLYFISLVFVNPKDDKWIKRPLIREGR
jgi:glycosyltransferase involved in cell wall biosynthesis